MPISNMVMEPGNLIVSNPYRLNARSGLMTLIAADADVFAMVNLSATKAVAISQIRTRYFTTTAFSASQALAFQFNKATGFTAIHSAGGGIAVSARQRKTSCGVVIPATEVVGQVSNTAAITAATYVIDDVDEPFEALVGGGSTAFGMTSRYVPVDGLPEVLEANEGIIGRVVNTMGAGGEGRLFVNVDFFRF